MMTTDAIGLYVHIPFCKSKCNYCDFCSYPSLEDRARDGYIERVISEARDYAKGEKIRVDTVYFGGGTPSLLSLAQAERLITSLADSFDISPSAEITLEANPGTLNKEKAMAYKTLGINRISLGLQTIHKNELKILGRIHTYDDFLSAYKLIRACGFDNVSIDLMYGIPEQTKDSFAKSLDTVTVLEPEHISAYGLIIEEGTPFYSMAKTLPLPSEDEECDMYFMAADMLRARGYSHYEISNYAKPGRQSRHNLKYWRDEEYIGLGAAAYSYFGGRRYGNSRSFDKYMAGAPYENVDIPDREGEMLEYAMMRLRLDEGIDLFDYKERFGISFETGREEKLSAYSKAGLLECIHGRVHLTERGFYLSNTIMADIL